MSAETAGVSFDIIKNYLVKNGNETAKKVKL